MADLATSICRGIGARRDEIDDAIVDMKPQPEPSTQEDIIEGCHTRKHFICVEGEFTARSSKSGFGHLTGMRFSLRQLKNWWKTKLKHTGGKNGMDNCIDPRDARADWVDLLVDTTLRRPRYSESARRLDTQQKIVGF